MVFIEGRGSSLKFQKINYHAQRKRGKVIGVGVHYIYVCGQKKKFESYISDRLTFSNIHGKDFSSNS